MRNQNFQDSQKTRNEMMSEVEFPYEISQEELDEYRVELEGRRQRELQFQADFENIEDERKRNLYFENAWLE